MSRVLETYRADAWKNGLCEATDGLDPRIDHSYIRFIDAYAGSDPEAIHLIEKYKSLLDAERKLIEQWDSYHPETFHIML